MTATLYFIAGLVLLTLAGDALVRGAVAIAVRLHVPTIIIGLTIVSMGTSAPELFVALQAALGGAPFLAVGNAIGSNIANSLIVLGLPALIAPIYLLEPGTRRSVIFMFAVSLAVFALATDGAISSFDGMLLLLLFAIYLAYGYVLAQTARRDARQQFLKDNPPPSLPLLKPVIMLVFGFVGLALGARLTVDGALLLAEALGIGQTVVGTTIVALGTTLPEISATLAAAFRRQAGVAVGNIIGSNIFNILGILGITALVAPLPVDPRLLSFDLWVMLGAAATLLPMAFLRRPIGRWVGSLLSLSYLAYLFLAFAG
ncbi:MAG TPA: calcium/sodium antiporter [Devosia sp.]|nr:calcium/sodium antiporter [Devosia sp.]